MLYGNVMELDNCLQVSIVQIITIISVNQNFFYYYMFSVVIDFITLKYNCLNTVVITIYNLIQNIQLAKKYEDHVKEISCHTCIIMVTLMKSNKFICYKAFSRSHINDLKKLEVQLCNMLTLFIFHKIESLLHN